MTAGERLSRRLRLAAGLLALGAAASPAWAQDPPAAAPASPASAAAEPMVLREWHLPQLEGIDDATLQRLTLPYLRKPFGVAQAQQLRDALLAEMAARGLSLGGAALRVIDAPRGIVALQVVEPRLRRIELSAAADAPLADRHVLQLLAREGVRDGALLDLRRLDAAMFALNDLPGVRAQASLAPSGDEARYDLVIERGWRRQAEGSVDLDNHGSRFNGRWRIGGLLRWNEPLDRGDNLDLRLQLGQQRGLASARAAYELPLDQLLPIEPSAWRASLALSALSYELGDVFAPLEARGRAQVLDLGLSRPLQRGRASNVVLRLGASRKQLEDRFDAFGLRTDKATRDLNLALSFEARDGWGGGGYSGGALTLQAGSLAIRSPGARADDAALGRRAAQGGFGKLGLQLNRLQALPLPGSTAWSVYGGLSGLWASKNLDPSEKFALGGAGAVRAYPPGEAAADRAAIATVELRHAIGAQWSLFALGDWGWARLQARPLAGADNQRRLRAAGLGLFFSDPAWFTLRGTLAWPGSEPRLTEPDDTGPRLNLQLQRGF